MTDSLRRMTKPAPGRVVIWGGVVLLLAYAAIVLWARYDPALIGQLRFLPGIGALAAVIANTSGTGGGVVFVPVFNGLREHGVMTLDPLRVTAASMGIQCFGMTIGGLRWTDRLLHQPAAAASASAGDAAVRPRDFLLVILAVLAVALPAMLAMQRLTMVDGQMILLGYKIFSIFLGLALIITTWTINHKRPERARLERIDIAMLLLIAIPGGALTALFSVGVGELVALYLFIRHYPVLLCTGTACVISSISVLVGSIWHIESGTMPWEIVLLAGPGAVLGAFLARPIALWLGAKRLKTLDGTWIVLSAVYLIVLNWVY
ncbi:sulfite exporter TauE/SafE family protein [Sphingorhabdus sp. SMR4y]|uniref:sulfite exporter TauE/SafE family protein n=1 Tax=Sphingorhabdus sp. SMR4y TaxID=2584094 RepID=UPI000B5CAC84|nr:sulfite exporter TauE/SafE family protein [Sphingorhabdus sp. SMR4y]ASK89910.1 sulfite exporter TauE/SafE [Sphingorhabdus sp. SMR4y]